MAIVAADITANFPELAAATNTQLTNAIARAYRRMDANVWDIWLDDGALYLAAHMTAIMLPSFRQGPVSSEKLGPAAKTYAVAPIMGADSWFLSTKYGREFLELMNILPGARFAVGTSGCADPDGGFTS